MQHVEAWYDVPHDDVALLHEPVNITRITTEAFCHDAHAINSEIEVFFLHLVFVVVALFERKGKKKTLFFN